MVQSHLGLIMNITTGGRYVFTLSLIGLFVLVEVYAEYIQMQDYFFFSP